MAYRGTTTFRHPRFDNRALNNPTDRFPLPVITDRLPPAGTSGFPVEVLTCGSVQANPAQRGSVRGHHHPSETEGTKIERERYPNPWFSSVSGVDNPFAHAQTGSFWGFGGFAEKVWRKSSVWDTHRHHYRYRASSHSNPHSPSPCIAR